MRTEVVPDLPEMEREFEMENGSDGAQVVENGVVAGGTATVGTGVVVGVATENSPVTHGEGEIKPIMLENESMGGLEEAALKTAPEGAGGVSGGISGDNGSAGSASMVSANGSAQITEAEARAMLIEDNARVKEDLKRANSRGKKTLVAVIVLAVALIAVGIGVSIIIGGIER